MERISDIDVYEFEWGEGGVESMMLTKLKWGGGGLVPRSGLEGGGEEEFYGVGGGGKCGWEIMHACMQEYMYAMCEGKKMQRWTLVVSHTYTVHNTQYIPGRV